jgi:hypothetical protein
VVVVRREAALSEARRKIGVRDFAHLVRRGEAGPPELVGVLGGRHVGRARVTGAPQAALEREVESNCAISIRVELPARAGVSPELALPTND